MTITLEFIPPGPPNVSSAPSLKKLWIATAKKQHWHYHQSTNENGCAFTTMSCTLHAGTTLWPLAGRKIPPTDLTFLSSSVNSQNVFPLQTARLKDMQQSTIES